MEQAARELIDSAVAPADEAPGRKRRPFRRDQILAAAVRLFNEHGYHATGMNDIGAEVGLTGPAIYRHFASKEEILESALLEAGSQMLARIEAITHSDMAPEAAIEALVENYVTTLLEVPALSSTVMLERRVLSEETQKWVERNLRLHVAQWVKALLRCRPELSDSEARLIVNGAVQIAMSIHQFPTDLPADQIHTRFSTMIRAALLADSE